MPVQIKDESLLEEFRAARRCEFCGKPTPAGCDPSHTFAKGRGFRMDIRENLTALCRDCHRAHHNGQRPLRCDLLALAAAREGLLQDDIELALTQIRWLKPRAYAEAQAILDNLRAGGKG